MMIRLPPSVLGSPNRGLSVEKSFLFSMQPVVILFSFVGEYFITSPFLLSGHIAPVFRSICHLSPKLLDRHNPQAYGILEMLFYLISVTIA